jgi:lysozyme
MTLEERIIQHEGLKLKKYKDTKGNWTIYVGHLCKPGEKYLGTREDAMRYLDIDIAIARQDLRKIFPQYREFSQARQECLIELLFNMGGPRFRGFVKMIHAINIGHWDDAAKELMDSKWYREDVGRERADELVDALRTE